jgi:hypothetical protein
VALSSFPPYKYPPHQEVRRGTKKKHEKTEEKSKDEKG